MATKLGRGKGSDFRLAVPSGRRALANLSRYSAHVTRRYSDALFMLWQWVPIYLIALLGVYSVLFAFTADTQSQRTSAEDLGFITFAVVVGALGACATLELFKRILPVRGAFHHGSLRRWLGTAGANDLEDLLGAHRVQQSRRGKGWSAINLYDIPLEQLAARISSAFANACSDPATAPNLARQWMGESPDQEDFVRRAEAAREQQYRALLALQHEDSNADHVANDLMAIFNESREQLARLSSSWRDSFPNAEQDSQNGLDGFQLATANTWRRIVSLTAVACAGFVGLWLACAFQPNVILLTAWLAALVGGFMSWVIRDLTAGLERWRQRP